MPDAVDTTPPSDEQRLAFGRVAELLAGLARAIDSAGGAFEMSYVTRVCAATREASRI